MNWYKTSQQQDFKDIVDPIPTDEDYVYDFFDREEEARRDVLNEFKKSKRGERQPWPVVPAARLNKIWNDYATYGVIRDTRGMDEIAERMIQNVHRLAANTYLMGHTQSDPEEDFKEYGIKKKDLERFYWDYAVDDNGQARISDYAMMPLQEDALELMKTKSYVEKLLIVDRMLNRIHCRSDLSALFVEGGSDSLDKLFGGEKRTFNLKKYKVAQGKQLDPRWNVEHFKNDIYRLFFETLPILDFKLLVSHGNIKEVKTYGLNFFKVPQEARDRLPMIIEIVSRAMDVTPIDPIEKYKTAKKDYLDVAHPINEKSYLYQLWVLQEGQVFQSEIFNSEEINTDHSREFDDAGGAAASGRYNVTTGELSIAPSFRFMYREFPNGFLQRILNAFPKAKKVYMMENEKGNMKTMNFASKR